MEKLNPKTPEQEQIEAFEVIKQSLQQKFHCSESEATAFLLSNKKTIGDIYDAETVEQYLNKPETEKEFNDFRINFSKSHETPEGQ